jgi:cation diffusion facilitator family transporter
MPGHLEHRAQRGIRAAQAGLLANAALSLVKLIAGILGNSYALIADAIESGADVFSSIVVWRGLRIASRDADEEFPFGYVKAEPLSAAVVALMLLGAAVGIAIQAAREIVTPHHAPAPFTLAVLVVVVLVKEILFRRVFAVAEEVESQAVRGDAWHHRSDAITSAAAAIGIGVALWGGDGWASADDWAALLAAGVIAWNGLAILRPAILDLMDRAADAEVVAAIEKAALGVAGVLAVEKLLARRAGLGYFVGIHVQADPALSLHEAHIIGGKVKSAISAAVPAVLDVLVHMEPYEGAGPA